MNIVGNENVSCKDLAKLVCLEGDKLLSKGTTGIISIFHLQRDEKYWPKPLEFDPTRFLPDTIGKIKLFSLLAFSTGPRDCLAQAMAMLKITIASIVGSFQITSILYKDIEELNVMLSLELKTCEALDCHFILRTSEKSE
ncbi:hypothetical protein ABEB36_008909 [Hypothenemus hampei]|uniref:Cytochrome P450 n=1 Tax=Hypothenemus hampei TaxID=57062 RepID=A0ABD1ENH5_HYPHA